MKSISNKVSEHSKSELVAEGETYIFYTEGKALYLL